MTPARVSAGVRRAKRRRRRRCGAPPKKRRAPRASARYGLPLGHGCATRGDSTHAGGELPRRRSTDVAQLPIFETIEGGRMSGRERGSPRARLRTQRGRMGAALPWISRRSSPVPEKGTGRHASLRSSPSDSLRRRGQHDTAKMMAQARRRGEPCSGRIDDEPVARVWVLSKNIDDLWGLSLAWRKRERWRESN